ncbi:hypothetical protein [Flagellimonas sp.]|uniref:hypothetical protein n=1 Tax=Flagellimonas sp. TaxID=2058762 RepID=UPI003B5B6C70
MNQNKLLLPILLLFTCISAAQTEEDDNYIEFNDRRNVVHGVYLGLTTSLGEIDGNSTYLGSLKVAYVANRKFEVGFAGVFLYSEKDNPQAINEDLIGAYGGLHLEPILFSKSWVNLSFPMLIGAGGVGYLTEDRFDEDFYEEDADAVFVVEPGMNMLFNVSRYLQLEVGMRYRFSSNIDLSRDGLRNINGFSAGVGIKVGVFNMGRNRYKKHLRNGQ